MRNKGKTMIVVMILWMLAVIAACSNNTEAPPAATATATAEPTASASTEPEPTAAEPITVKFSEVIRSIFYAPHYIAMSQGFFEDEGLIIDMTTSQGSDKGAAALIAGTADISLVGPETAIYIFNQEGDDKIKIFHQLTMKDGSFLLSREPVDAFSWSELAGKTVLGWRPGSAPQMVFQSQLNKEGIEGVDVVTNLASTALTGAFVSGQGDYIQQFEPVASTLIQDGTAHFVASMGEAFGEFPETSYVATSSYIAEHPDVIQKFVNAVAKGNEWLTTASDADIAAALAPFFEGTSDDLIVQSVNRYKEQDTWPAVPELTLKAFETLQSVLIENGVLPEEDKIMNINDVVDMSFVQNIGKE